MAEIPVNVSDESVLLAPGREIALRGAEFLVHAPVEVRMPGGGSYREQRALARQLTPTGRDTRIVRLDVLRDDPVARRRRAQLEDEVRLHLSVRGLPRVVVELSEVARLSFVTDMPAGVPLTDSVQINDLLPKLPALARTLEGLHAAGRAHRALRPEVLIVSHDRLSLRDAGLAATPPEAGEGPDDYRAPEQDGPDPVIAGPATDVYQLAAVIYHLATGRLPGPSPSAAGLPQDLAAPLLAALAPAPADRPSLLVMINSLSVRAG